MQRRGSNQASIIKTLRVSECETPRVSERPVIATIEESVETTNLCEEAMAGDGPLSNPTAIDPPT